MEGGAGWYYYHSAVSNDWDLNAVVRYACGGRVPPPPPSPDDPFSSSFPTQEAAGGGGMFDAATSLPGPGLPFSGDAAAIDELSIAFFAPSAPLEQLQLQVQPAAATNEETLQPRQDDAVPPPPPQPTGRQASRGEGPRSKRKKRPVRKEMKRVASDGMSADPWAWRKYGQKPIKGSPYPRGYYRCSTDKACQARKMVERCRDDPDSIILTYTGGEHSHAVPVHRNSLAGTTRNRQQRSTATQPSPGRSTSGGTMSASPTTTASPRSPSMEECNQLEEAECDGAGGGASKDVEMDDEDDELKKLLDTVINPGGDPSGYLPMEDDGRVEETFLATPWATALGDAAGWS